MLETTRKQYSDLRQCRSCEHDHGKKGCDVLLDMLEGYQDIDNWCDEQEWRNGQPRVDADGCPGWRLRQYEWAAGVTGSTAGFDPVGSGSNPGWPTITKDKDRELQNNKGPEDVSGFDDDFE